MKHNFSRELACFSLAQDIIESIVQIGEGDILAFSIDNRAIKKCFLNRIGRDCNSEEFADISEAIILLGPNITKDCATFEFAHYIFHLVED